MLLCDTDIARAIGSRRIIIEPNEPALLQPSSIDVRLDQHLLVWPDQGGFIDPAVEQRMEPVEILDGGAYALMPGRMVLASTVERVTLDATLAGRVEGKSSLGRLGLATHITAGFIDPGFSGHITLELVNHAPRPILLHAGMRIGQLCLFQLTGPARWPYGSSGVGSHYQGQRGPTASRSHIGWRTWPTNHTDREVTA
ncbi:dCTP deaminase [Micromonospora sp. NPDC000207]|uniref:dCTP deaminase n=1 Tax=Micromonospora sp. NPDC000207 TaxID=3154246 RepID=UPI003320CE13